jgi:hypothetical protein
VHRDPSTGEPDLPFRAYVERVFAAEWPSSYPIETLKTGAIAVKQFAWYYTIVYRGGMDADGVCYDVRDDTIDQWYDPARPVKPPTVRTLDATWGIHLRKFEADSGRGRFFLTGYRSGAHGVDCGDDRDGFRLYQHSAFWCGKDGLGMEQILRRYLESRLEIVEPGQHDIVGTSPGQLGSEMGDISAVVVRSKGARVPHI